MQNMRENIAAQEGLQKRMTAVILDLNEPNTDREAFIRRMINSLKVKGFTDVVVVGRNNSLVPLQTRGWIFILCDGAQGIGREMGAIVRRKSAHIVFVVSPNRSEEERQAGYTVLTIRYDGCDTLDTNARGGWTDANIEALNEVIGRSIKDFQMQNRRIGDPNKGTLSRVLATAGIAAA